jgi:hypothetical protein
LLRKQTQPAAKAPAGNIGTEKNMNEAKATVMQLLLLAGIVLGTVVVKGALAAERGGSGIGAGAGFQSNHISAFSGPTYYRTPSPPPVFNQSNPYTVPQSPEKPVSPGSPGSVFGDH